MRMIAVVFALMSVIPTSAEPPSAKKMGLPLVFNMYLSQKNPEKAFEFTDPKAWTIKKDKGHAVLALVADSKYKPKVRSPLNIAWVKDLEVGEFVMEVELRSTIKDYNHRDLCLFFGGVDPSHFYYVHLGKKPDPHAHNIFLVNDKPRVAIASKVDEGTPWDDQYHTARIVRKANGDIEVYFDDKLTMKGNDKTFPTGRVGVGSFDDTGNFARITVWGKKK